jgi:hypothetical protein
MRAMTLGARRGDEAVRVVRALGSHRYVAGRLHLVHAFAIAALDAVPEGLAEARAWAEATLRDGGVDKASRDEALWRRCTDAEVAAVVEAYWATEPSSRARSRGALFELLAEHDLAPPPESAPFDEGAEDAMHPVLVDAGWELVPLAELDAERHRGAMNAYGDALSFESARFEEETAIPPTVHLYELPALGAAELLCGVRDDGELAEPLVVWADGDETYVDYVIRGVRRAARLPEHDEE